MLVPVRRGGTCGPWLRERTMDRLRRMVIDRHARPSPPAKRPAIWLAASAVALLALASLVVPVLAVDPPDAPASPPASASGSPSVDPSPSASPSADPSASPTPSPSASPAPSPSPSPSPSPTPSPTPTPTPVDPDHWPAKVTTLGATVTFHGRGYGHGVGMSQYGARGRALAGETAAQILAAYFEGSKPATTSPTQVVRVLLLAGYAAVRERPAHDPRPRRSVDRSTAWTAPSRRTARVRVWRTTARSTGSRRRPGASASSPPTAKTSLYDGQGHGPVVVRPASRRDAPPARRQAGGYDTYRGSLKVVLKASSASVVEPGRPRQLPARCRPGRDACQLAGRGAERAGRRRPELRRPAAAPGHGLVRRLRRHAFAGLPRRRGREGEDEQGDRRRARRDPEVRQAGRQRVLPLAGGGATENNEYAFVGSTAR